MASRKSNIVSFLSASNSSKYLVPEWHERIHEDCVNEDVDNDWPIQMLDENCRNMVWCICQLLGVGTETVAPTACLILEKYLAKKTRRAFTLLAATGVGDRRDFMQETNQRMPLLAATSVQLVSKMSSNARHITAFKVQLALSSKGFKYTIHQITSAEFEVFEHIGFKVPLWSSLETAQLLLREAGLSLALLPTVARSVELAELKRPTLQHAVAPNPREIPRLGTLHLCAGAVAAAARLCRVAGDPAPALAALARAPEALVRLLADLLVAMVLGGDSGSECSSSD